MSEIETGGEAEAPEATEAEPEVWKATRRVVGYEVSNMGTVRDASTKEVLSQNDDARGYRRVYIRKDKSGSGKGVLVGVQRLVAEAFLPDLGVPRSVHHINGDLHDNRACNLEWGKVCSSVEWEHAKRAKQLADARRGYSGVARTCANCSKFHAVGSTGEGLCYDRIWVFNTASWATCNVWAPTIRG